MDFRAGEILVGKYRVERVLGEGGMGIVVSATHIGFDDRVAIKLMLPQFAQNTEVVARFLREGRASRKIQSEHVVRVNDVGTLENGAPYMVMEHLDGADLATTLDTYGPLAIGDAVEYLLQACEALAEAHVLNIVHRDLKPANLFLTRRRDGSPCVKVLDFGISKAALAGPAEAALTKTSGMMGSPLYMSPEQLQSARDVDARADLWALGVILFELLAGVQPFSGETLPQLSIAIMLSPPKSLASLRPDVPPGLQSVIECCLSKDRAHRFRNVAELASALEPYAPSTARLSIDRILRVSDPLQSGAAASFPRPQARAPVSNTISATSTSTLSEDASQRPAPSRRTLVIAAVALLSVSVVGVGLVVFRTLPAAPTTRPTAATKSFASAPPPPTVQLAAEPEVTAAPSTPATQPAIDPPTAKAKPKAPPPPSSTATLATSAAPKAPKPNCEPPFTIDAKGHKLPKLECL